MGRGGGAVLIGKLRLDRFALGSCTGAKEDEARMSFARLEPDEKRYDFSMA
jgi:hypothetical protein